MQISQKRSKINFRSFLWHSIFLALASNFMDVDTIIPSMLIKAGGTSVHLGLLTAIMIGGTGVFQLIFASGLSKRPIKKNFLLIGVNLRVFSLLLLGGMFYKSGSLSGDLIIFLIFMLISLFSLSGSYSAISYNDIFGKSIRQESRKHFFSLQQTLNSIGIFFSAWIVRDLIKRFEYPDNYALLFLIAGGLLLIATLGFWNIREVYYKSIRRKNIIDFFRLIPSEIKGNSNLKNYLLIINSLGLGLSFSPFLILFAKENFSLSYALIGNILLFKVIGMLIGSISFYKVSDRISYKTILKISILIGGLLPVLALLFGNNQMLYQYLFILSGIFFAFYRISNAGVLMEITNNNNRALYTGIAGAGNLLTVLFPLAAGFLIKEFDYIAVFSSVSILIFASYFFVNRLDCKPT